MSDIALSLYRMALSLWFGGMAVFSLVMTPVIFRTQPRDVAARVVGVMMPVYFRYALVAVVAALAARLTAGGGVIGPRTMFGTGILGAALFATLWQAFVLVPRMERVKALIPSFEERDAHHPARREFGRLHATSVTLNFLLMAAAALLIATRDPLGP